MPNTILATPQALAAIERAKAAHGDVMFHVAGGCCDAHSPILLPVDELRLGARDLLMGTCAGVSFFMMASTPNDAPGRDATYLLDLSPGTSVGFSIEAGPNLRFILREKTRATVSAGARL